MSVGAFNPSVIPNGIIAFAVALWLNMRMPMIKTENANVHGYELVIPPNACLMASSLCAMKVLLIHTTPNTLINADAMEVNKLAFTIEAGDVFVSSMINADAESVTISIMVTI